MTIVSNSEVKSAIWHHFKFPGDQDGLRLVFESPWQLTICYKAFVVSGTHVHFGCRGDQSPSGQQSKQWEPQTAVLSLLGLISLAYPEMSPNKDETAHGMRSIAMVRMEKVCDTK